MRRAEARDVLRLHPHHKLWPSLHRQPSGGRASASGTAPEPRKDCPARARTQLAHLSRPLRRVQPTNPVIARPPSSYRLRRVRRGVGTPAVTVVVSPVLRPQRALQRR